MRPDTRLRLDASVRRRGALLVGGSPLRLLRLGRAGTRLLDRWIDGEPVGTATAARTLARRLVDAGLAHPEPPAGPRPEEVTLVVPVKDDPEGLRAVLDATRDTGFAERLVVDDGSRVPVDGARVRHERPAGPAAARNAGWRSARTPFVAFLDADTRPGPDWLAPLLAHLGDDTVVAAAPRVRGVPGDGALAAYEADRGGLDLGARPAPVRPLSRVGYVPAAALVVRTAALRAVDGFDPALRFGEDVDLVWRLREHGSVRYEPASVVRHEPRARAGAWLRQRFEYGTSAAPLARRHPGLLHPARLSGWSAAAWALAAAGRPYSGAAVAAVTTALLPRKLRGRGILVTESLRLAALGHLGAGRILAEAVRRAWWPLALPTRRGRAVLAAALLPALVPAVVDAVRGRHVDRRLPARLLLRLADDLAYGAGVWAGCARHRTAAPLLPALTEVAA